MKKVYITFVLLTLFVLPTASSQHHYSNWVHKNAADSTIVRCWNDSLTMIGFPSGSMMGMMFPDSLFCRVTKMPMDSLFHPYDSTFIGWCRAQMGRDSMHYDMMDDSMMGGNHMMQFMSSIRCQLYWDSLMTDSMHRRWNIIGVHGWNGTQWITMNNVSIIGKTATFSSSTAYSAYAFIGNRSGATSIQDVDITRTYVLQQNYPNPFNPTTKITYHLPVGSLVKLVILNVLGQTVATLVNSEQTAGDYNVEWLPNTSSGIYFYKLETINIENGKVLFNQVGKMVFMK